MMYLLDTNTVSDMIRNPQGLVTQKVAAIGQAAVTTSIIVAAELRFGAAKRGSEKLIERLEGLLQFLPVLALDRDADVHYGKLRVALEAKGEPIGANDMLIAAHALAMQAILVTDNTQEFRRVDGLKLENWLR
jgi:tRNA(fMet)-specific endonuclease VapC